MVTVLLNIDMKLYPESILTAQLGLFVVKVDLGDLEITFGESNFLECLLGKGICCNFLACNK